MVLAVVWSWRSENVFVKEELQQAEDLEKFQQCGIKESLSEISWKRLSG